MSDIQWGRQATAIFKNYEINVFTKINDYATDEPKFRIEFDYTKSIDESSNMSNGSIKIYGLTPERFEILGEPMECEIEFYVGYEKSTTYPLNLLFKAILVDKSYEHSGGISVSTFRVLGDFIKANVSNPDSKAVSGSKVSYTAENGILLLDVIAEIASQMGAKDYGIVPTWESSSQEVRRSPEYLEWSTDFENYVGQLNYPLGISLYGTPKQALEVICADFGMTWSLANGNEVLRLAFTDAALEYHKRRAKELNNVTLNNPIKVADNKTPPATLTAADHEMRRGLSKFENRKVTSLVLNKRTGLKGIPSVKTKQVTKGYSQALTTNERLHEQKAVKTKKNAKGEIVVDKNTGKPSLVIPKTKKVWRRTIQAACLINTLIEPQTYVTIETDVDNRYINGDYRVRTVQIQGDTDGTSWDMNLELEGEF